MYCRECGSELAEDSRFCECCGRSAGSPRASDGEAGWSLALDTYVPAARVAKSKDFLGSQLLAVGVLVVIACFIFHRDTAILAILLIMLCAVVLHLKWLTSRVKLIVVAVALGTMLVSNTVEGWRARREQQRHEEADRQEAAARAEQQREQDEAFRRLSPQEHLRRAEDQIKLGASQSALDDGFKELDAIDPKAPEYTAGQQLREQYEAAKKKDAEAQAKMRAAAAKKQVAEGVKTLELARKDYPSEVERSMLDQGYDMTVRALGPHRETLQIEWALMDRLFVHQFINSPEAMASPQSLGFKRLVFVNSVTGDTWSESLAPDK